MEARLSQSLNAGLAADAKALNGLNTLAGKDSRAALKETARQFESLFMRELLKSMREATMKSGLLESSEGDLATDLLDQQWAVQMSGLPGGLSEMIEAQLAKTLDPDAAGAPVPNPAPAVGSGWRGVWSPPASAQSAAPAAPSLPMPERLPAFVQQHQQAALAVARETGIPASYMLGQAGHETGWGRGEIRHADGAPAHNLFGIKAGAGWQGKVAEVTTTEYIDGQPRKVVARFRAYESYADSFRDYARLIGNSPRYAGVMENLGSPSAFAAELQQAGYATDPAYASKLSRAINATLNVQRATRL